MTRHPILSTVTRVLAAAALAATALGGAWAVAEDFTRRDVLPEGTSIDGRDAGGLTIRQARELIEAEVADPLLAPLTAVADGREVTLDADSYLRIDVDGMIEEAIRPRRDGSLPERVWARITGAPVGRDVPVSVSADTAALARWVETLADEVDAEARDATITVSGSGLDVVAAREGRLTRRDEAVERLTDALVLGRKRVDVPIERIEPAVDEKALGKSILVRLSERRLYLYDGGDLEKTYRVAVGTAGFPTPQGRFSIVLKRYLPTWVNPGSAWAAGMPKSIGPGPGNPLGTRALNLDAPGIRIHGTSNNASIGTAASHGCMRMHRWDIEDLYERVEVGTRVFIVP